MDKLKNVFKVIFDILKKIALFLLQMFKKAWSVKALRPVIIVIIIVLVIYIKTSVDKIGNESKAIKEYSNFIWPSNQLVNTIEKYNTDKGKVLYSTDKWFSMRLFIANKKEFLNYIEKIKQKGYDLEEDFTGNKYTAKNRNDNLLKIEIEYLDKDNNTYIRHDMMEITIKKEESKEEKEKREKEARELEAKEKAEREAKEAEERAKRQKAEEEQKAKERKEQEQKKNESPKTTSNTIDPQFKKAMDSYESAMKEYSSFMKKYTSSSNPVSMMTDYNRIMEKYTNANNEFNKIKKESLNSAELAYYLEVQSRVVKNIN